MPVPLCGFVYVSALPVEGRGGCRIPGAGVIRGCEPKVVSDRN